VTWLDDVQEDTGEWLEETVPDAEPLDQAGHVSTEASELLDLLVKEKQYADYEADPGEIRKEAGDVVVALMSFCELEDIDLSGCVEAALDKNESRDWGEHKAREGDE